LIEKEKRRISVTCPGTIREAHPDGVKAVEDWMKKWVSSAGYKRLGKILADRWG
jgi:hypothetical protein